MQAQFQKFLKQNCIYYPFNLKVFLYCCLLIIAFHNNNVQFSRCSSSKSNPHFAHSTQALNAPCGFVSPLPFKPASLGFEWTLSLRDSMKSHFRGTSVNLFKKKWWPRTRFPAGKPRRLQQSTGLLPRAAFQVHFGFACRQNSIASVLTPCLTLLQKWWAKDSLSCGKATAVATVHRTVAKSRLSSPFWLRLPSELNRLGLDSLFYSFAEVVGQNGLEPSTSRLSVVCSSQLSYWPISASLLFWWRLAGSNR